MKSMQIVPVSAAIILKEGKVLVGKRREGLSNSGKWEFPGGKIRPGEDPKDSVGREIEEELGTRLSVGRLYDAVNHSYPEKNVLILFYLAEIESSIDFSDCCSLKEHDEILWVEPEELLKINFLDADRKVAVSLAEDLIIGGVS